MNEHDIQNQLMINISKNPNLTPFRVNVGTGWAGIPFKNRDGTMTLKNPRPFRTGVPKGFPDVFVLNKRKIKQEDVKVLKEEVDADERRKGRKRRVLRIYVFRGKNRRWQTFRRANCFY